MLTKLELGAKTFFEAKIAEVSKGSKFARRLKRSKRKEREKRRKSSRDKSASRREQQCLEERIDL